MKTRFLTLYNRLRESAATIRFRDVKWEAVLKYRHYLIFLALPIITLLGVMIALMVGSNAVSTSLLQVDHSSMVINKNQEVSIQIERMLSNQRGWILSGDSKMRMEYSASKGEVSDILAELSSLMSDDETQASRLAELQHHFLTYTEKLDDQAINSRGSGTLKKGGAATSAASARTESVDQVKENITRISNDILLAEHDLLNKRLKSVDRTRAHVKFWIYSMCLLSLGFFAVFNFYLFRFRLYLIKESAEPTLGEAEDVFRLAIEGSSDGIFEWNLETDKSFYSRQFWNMLGYEPGVFADTMQSFKDLLHPEDYGRVLAHIENYLTRAVSEYLIIFRLRHKSGRWVWINARSP